MEKLSDGHPEEANIELGKSSTVNNPSLWHGAGGISPITHPYASTTYHQLDPWDSLLMHAGLQKSAFDPSFKLRQVTTGRLTCDLNLPIVYIVQDHRLGLPPMPGLKDAGETPRTGWRSITWHTHPL